MSARGHTRVPFYSNPQFSSTHILFTADRATLATFIYHVEKLEDYAVVSSELGTDRITENVHGSRCQAEEGMGQPQPSRVGLR